MKYNDYIIENCLNIVNSFNDKFSNLCKSNTMQIEYVFNYIASQLMLVYLSV